MNKSMVYFTEELLLADQVLSNEFYIERLFSSLTLIEDSRLEVEKMIEFFTEMTQEYQKRIEILKKL